MQNKGVVFWNRETWEKLRTENTHTHINKQVIIITSANLIIYRSLALNDKNLIKERDVIKTFNCFIICRLLKLYESVSIQWNGKHLKSPYIYLQYNIQYLFLLASV